MAADVDVQRTRSATRDRTPMLALLAANAVSSIGMDDVAGPAAAGTA